HSLTRRHTHTHTHTHTEAYTHTHTNAHTYTYNHTHAHTRTRTHTHTHTHTHLLNIQVGDVHVHQAALHTLHHAVVLEVGQQVPHDGRSQAANPLAQNIRL